MNIFENNYMYMHLEDILKFWALKNFNFSEG